MFFVTYKYKEGLHTGVLTSKDSVLIPFKEIFSKLSMDLPKTMHDFITIGDTQLIKRMATLLALEGFHKIPLSEVKLCAPIPNPNRNLICLGKNYLDHVKELKGLTSKDSSIPNAPIYFSKMASPAIGYGDTIQSHSDITREIDYEVELAVIIGKDGINIEPEEVEDYIFGYTIANDITARDLQRSHTQWHKGKSLDTFAPMGPYIVHKSALPLPIELDLTCKVNGTVRQQSNTRHMIFNIPYIISDLSKGLSLKTGDIILTGTPSGVGLGYNPPKFLKSGDIVECTIENIGSLINQIE